MRRLTLLVFGVTGCVSMTSRFAVTDPTFASKLNRDAPTVLLEKKDIEEARPFHVVGLLEVVGNDFDSLSKYMNEIEHAGAEHGCSFLIQRGAYEHRMESFQVGGIAPGSKTNRSNGLATWQFLCGVSGNAGEAEERKAEELALVVANQALAGERGSECGWSAEIGSHIATWRCRATTTTGGGGLIPSPQNIHLQH